jgi:hypothetical protein
LRGGCRGGSSSSSLDLGRGACVCEQRGCRQGVLFVDCLARRGVCLVRGCVGSDVVLSTASKGGLCIFEHLYVVSFCGRARQKLQLLACNWSYWLIYLAIACGLFIDVYAIVSVKCQPVCEPFEQSEFSFRFFLGYFFPLLKLLYVPF